MKKLILLLVLACGSGFLAAPMPQADEGAEIIQAHPIAPYPDSVRERETERTVALTKDSLEKVKKYFASKAKSGDKFASIKNDEEQGYILNYHAVLSGKEQTVMEAECYERTPAERPVDALGALKSQSMLGRHSGQEFQALEAKYKNLSRAYFRMVADGKGGTEREDILLYQKAREQAYPEKDRQKAAHASDEFKNEKANAAELKARMKALKAQGDFAGMMQLAQESKMSSSQSAAVQDAMEVQTKDTWDIWVKCLKDTAAAAYWTRIEYNGSALPAQK